MPTYRMITDERLAAGIAQTRPQIPTSFKTQMVTACEDAAIKYMNREGWWFRAVDRVEWFTPSDDESLWLSLTPVESVSEVRLDPRGGFGQIPDSFGDDTVMAAGTDYYLELDRGDGTSSGRLYRNGYAWNGRGRYKAGLLTQRRVPSPGSVKVTYTGGYTVDTTPTELQLAIVRMLVIAHQTIWTVAPVGSEMIGGYNYSRHWVLDLNDNVFAGVRVILDKYKRRHVTNDSAN